MLEVRSESKVEAYRAALDELSEEATGLDLEIRRLQNERAQMTELIKFLKSKIASLGGGEVPDRELGIGPTAFLGMTVRDAIKMLFRDYSKEPLTTSEIKVRLAEGGVRSSGVDFLSNVSATLSVMSKTHKEVERGENGKWQLTQTIVPDFDPGISDDDVPF